MEVYAAVRIHECGKEDRYFEPVIPLLQEGRHLLIPALPGYDFEDDSDFAGVEPIVS